MNWIDEEKKLRDQGINCALTQSQHAAVNARYPGTTLEYCCECGNPTGMAGEHEDSFYTEDDGPFCWDCYPEKEEEDEGVNDLEHFARNVLRYLRREEWRVDHPPKVKKQYGEWTIVGEPLPSLARNELEGNEYQTQWQVPCRCRCGRRDLVDVQDLEVGASIQCVVCDKFGFPESILIRPGKRSKVIEAFGEKKCICDWVKDPRCTCEHSASIRYRLKRGMSPEEAIASPRRDLGKRLNKAKKTRTQAKSRRENIYDNIPNIKKYYKDWTVVGEPLPFLNVNNVTKGGYQTRWKAPCECACGRRDLIDIQNLMNGRSGRCIVCGIIAFDKIPRPGRPPKLVEAFGEKKSIMDWVKDFRCIYSTRTPIDKRLNEGMALEEIILNSRGKGRPRKFTDAQAREIYARVNAGERGIDLAKEFETSGTTVSHIKTGKMYADTTQNQ